MTWSENSMGLVMGAKRGSSKMFNIGLTLPRVYVTELYMEANLRLCVQRKYTKS